MFYKRIAVASMTKTGQCFDYAMVQLLKDLMGEETFATCYSEREPSFFQKKAETFTRKRARVYYEDDAVQERKYRLFECSVNQIPRLENKLVSMDNLHVFVVEPRFSLLIIGFSKGAPHAVYCKKTMDGHYLFKDQAMEATATDFLVGLQGVCEVLEEEYGTTVKHLQRVSYHLRDISMSKRNREGVL